MRRRELMISNEKIPNGLYIQGISGKLYTKEEWSKQESANGIAVVTDECSFVYVKSDSNIYGLQWSSEEGIVPNITVEPTSDLALFDYNGQKNTKALIDAYGEESELASLCYENISPIGLRCYLPSLGECDLYYKNFHEINNVLLPLI